HQAPARVPTWHARVWKFSKTSSAGYQPALRWYILRRVEFTFRMMRHTALFLTCALLAGSSDRRVVFPAGAKPVGPYSPGIFAGEFLYVSGQGARGPDGKIPTTFDAQAKQSFENVKSIVETAGLTMEHVV